MPIVMMAPNREKIARAPVLEICGEILAQLRPKGRVVTRGNGEYAPSSTGGAA